MNKQQLQQEIAELQKQLEEKQKALSAMPDKWRPKAGKFYVDEDGAVSEITSHFISNQDFGNQHATREQAEKAAKAMRAHNRLLAYVAEFAPEFVGDWREQEQGKSFVLFDNESKRWFSATAYRDRNASSVYMPRHIAEDLAAKLNSGEVEL